MAVVLFIAAFLQFEKISFGLPGLYRLNDVAVDYWYGDEDKELPHIESYLQPKATMLPLNYPPLQYLLAAAVNFPTRALTAAMPQRWKLGLTSRVISALAVLCSAYVLFLIVSRIDRLAGIFSAVLFSMVPITVEIGNDMKPIALGGFFILSAIYFSMKNYEEGFSKKRCIFVGICLGLACMCSHLALAFLSLPLIVLLFSHVLPYSNKRAEEITPHTLQAPGRPGWGVAVCLGVIGIAFIGWYLTSYQKEIIVHFAERMYARQEHTQPFSYHIPAIQAYLRQIRNILVISMAGGLFLTVYFVGRRKLLGYKAFNVLPFAESTYASAIAVILLVLTCATALNNLIPLSLLNFVISGKAYSTINAGYYGLYPGNIMPPSFFVDIFPQCLGLPLLILAVGSLVMAPLIYRPNRHLLLLLCLFVPFALQISLWNTTFRASRFAFNLFFLLYIFAGILISLILHRPNKVIRFLGILLFTVIAGYTLLYSIANNRAKEYVLDARVQTALWMDANIPKSSKVAVSGTADLPRSLGPIKTVPGITYQEYQDQPDYCVLDGFEYFVIQKYFSRIQQGYAYIAKDWWPSKYPPDEHAISSYDLIVNEKAYKLIEKFSSEKPKMLGFRFRRDLLDDPAFFFHNRFFVYKKIQIYNNLD